MWQSRVQTQTQSLLGMKKTKIQRSDIKGSDSKVNQENPKCGVVTNTLSWRRALQSPVDQEKRKKAKVQMWEEKTCCKLCAVLQLWLVFHGEFSAQAQMRYHGSQGAGHPSVGFFSEKDPCSAIDFWHSNNKSRWKFLRSEQGSRKEKWQRMCIIKKDQNWL